MSKDRTAKSKDQERSYLMATCFLGGETPLINEMTLVCKRAFREMLKNALERFECGKSFAVALSL